MLAVVHAIAARLDATGTPWRLAGSAAALVRGARVRPGDVDIEVAGPDADRAARALGLPPPAHAEGGGWSSLRSAGTINGVAIDLSADLRVTGPGGTLHADDAPVDTVTGTGVRGGICLIPMGEALARAIVAGSDERRAKALAALPADAGERAGAIAYAESRVAAAARAAR